jgi:cytochrome P450
MVNVTGVLPRSLLRWPPYRRSRARCLELARGVLDAHRSGQVPRRQPSLIHDILDAAEADPGLIAPDELVNAALGPFVAGLDTVANALTFIVYRLLAHPDVMERVRAEADRMFEDGAPDPERLPYLRAVCMETLRLHPVAPLGMRFAQQEFAMDGCRIPRDAALIMATAVPHYLEEHFPAPERFEPERFQAPRQEHRAPGVYAPYGLGTHTCLGAGLAELQMVLTIATLLRRVRLKLYPPGYRLKSVMSPSLMPGSGFRMVVTERRPEA